MKQRDHIEEIVNYLETKNFEGCKSIGPSKRARRLRTKDGAHKYTHKLVTDLYMPYHEENNRLQTRSTVRRCRNDACINPTHIRRATMYEWASQEKWDEAKPNFVPSEIAIIEAARQDRIDEDLAAEKGLGTEFWESDPRWTVSNPEVRKFFENAVNTGNVTELPTHLDRLKVYVVEYTKDPNNSCWNPLFTKKNGANVHREGAMRKAWTHRRVCHMTLQIASNPESFDIDAISKLPMNDLPNLSKDVTVCNKYDCVNPSHWVSRQLVMPRSGRPRGVLRAEAIELTKTLRKKDKQSYRAIAKKAKVPTSILKGIKSGKIYTGVFFASDFAPTTINER